MSDQCNYVDGYSLALNLAEVLRECWVLLTRDD